MYVSTGPKSGVREPEGTFPPPASRELRSFALEDGSLGLSRGCSLGSYWHLPLIGRVIGKHLKTSWAGDRDQGRLEAEGSNSTEVTR